MKYSTVFQFKTLFLSLTLTALYFIPFTTQAAYEGPVCVLWVQTTSGSFVAAGESEVLVNKGDDVEIFWFSVNATEAKDINGDRIPLTGRSVKSPTSKTTYSYTFSKGTREFECSVAVYPVEGKVTASTLSSRSHTPTISGTAKNTKTVSFEVLKFGSKSVVYKSGAVNVVDGVWNHKVTDSILDGSYSLVLHGSDELKLNTISKQALTIGTLTTPDSSMSTVVVQPIPLLVGGVAKRNQTVGLSYLQLLNVGLQPVTITGIKMKQTGTASTDTIVRLMATDDTELHTGQVGTIGTSPFKSGEALIPITLTLKPKETRLMTLKALLVGDLSNDVGDTLKLQVSGVNSRSSVKGTFPIRGVTWTLAQ